MPSLLNELQLQRIENVHGGFLYQHLYAVAIILSWSAVGWQSVEIERDEDIEVCLPESRLYIQVKKRAGNLTFGDIADVLNRFELLRSEHLSGAREGAPECWIISNAEPGADLTKRLSEEWPRDVFLLTPRGRPAARESLPSPGAGLLQMLEICVRLSGQVPHSTLQAETLVWKLAALSQWLASGAAGRDHTLGVGELKPLLEQLISQLQSLPEPLSDYRPQENEPAYETEDSVRLITGFSGAGKTSWVAELGTHTSSATLYFDVADLPSASIPAALARELAAFVLPEGSQERKQILLPGVSGLQSLRLIDRYVAEHALPLRVVLDNAHRVEDQLLADIVRTVQGLKWIVVAQDWPGGEYLATVSRARVEALRGWSRDTIAQEATSFGCSGSIEDFQWIHDLTGGLPLFIRDACRLCREGYGGVLDSYLQDLSAHVTLQISSQEVIVSQVFGRLSSDAQSLASLLSIFTVPFHREVVLSISARSLRLTRTEAARQLRSLSSWGILRFSAGGDLFVHDSFKLLIDQRMSALAENVVMEAREALYQIVWNDRSGGGPEKFRLLSRLALETKRITELVDMLANSAEIVTEFGLQNEMAGLLGRASVDESLSPLDRFWAEDTLTYWALQSKDLGLARGRFANMKSLMGLFTPSESESVALLTKDLLISGQDGNLAQLRASFKAAIAACPNAVARRVVTYNYARGLLSCRRPELALEIAKGLVDEYYSLLGIGMGDVLLKRLSETAAKIKDLDENYEEVKRLADCLDLQGSAAHGAGMVLPFAKLHAHKFYIITSSFSSAVRVGMDYVDELLGTIGDALCARSFIEQFLLTIVHEQKMLGELVPVSCLYAVVLAHCGEFELATQTLREMGPYTVEGTAQAHEYATQTALIERIRKGEVRLSKRRVSLQAPARQERAHQGKVGRNVKCPCESGLKYKKCCGR